MRRRSGGISATTACAAGLICAVFAQLAPAARPTARGDVDYLIDTWETEDGLPENSATAMVQDRSGYLWFGTFRGLVRFDGVEFTCFNPANTPQLSSEGIVNLHLDRAGRLWVSTLRGLAIRDGSGWRTINSTEGWAGDFVRTFSERSNGDLLLTTFNGLILECVGSKLRQLPLPPGPPGQGYFGHVDELGRWWVVRPDFVGSWDGSQWVPDPKLGHGAAGCGAARDGGMWLLSGSLLQKCRQGAEVRRVELPTSPGGLWNISEDSRGNVWITTFDQGLCRVSPSGEFKRWNTSSGLAYDGTRFVFEDAESNLWVGTSGGGLQRFKPRRFRSIGIESGLPERIVRSVAPDDDGGVWIGTYGKGLFRWHNGTMKTVALPGWDGSAVYVQSVLTDRVGRKWVGTFGQGLWLLERGEFRRIPFDQTAGGNVIMLFEDSRGRIWINGGQGIAVYDAGTFHSFVTTEGAPRETVRFAEDGEGTIWLASREGVFRFIDGHFPEVTENGRPIRDVNCLSGDSAGVVWISHSRDTLLCSVAGALKSIGTTSGLPTTDINTIVDDANGYLWLTSTHGVTRVKRDELLAFADGKRGAVTSQTFDLEDGLPSTEFPAGCQPACGRDKNGRLWFATSKGVAMIDPAALRLNTVPPPLDIQSLIYHAPTARAASSGLVPGAPGTTGESLSGPFIQPPNLPPGSRRIEIHYAALSFAAPAKVRYQVRLENLDEDWHYVAHDRVAHYEPRPGNYVFRVRAANNDGAWNTTGASLAFAVQPFFWQTGWFRGGIGLALIGGGAIVAWQMAHSRHRRERERLRRREQQSAALLKLSVSPALMRGDLTHAFHEIAKASAPVLEVPRVCISLMDGDRDELRCAELFSLVPDGPAASATLEASRFPAYFEALQRGRPVDVRDAMSDARTSDLADYLARHGINSVLAAPVRAGGTMVGAIRFEHCGAPRTWRNDEVGFADAVANQIAQVLLNAERERAHAELRENEERFRLMADASPMMVWRAGVDARCNFLNKQWLEFSGRTLEQQLGEGWSEGVHPDDLAQCLETYRAAFAARKPFQMEYRLRRADGEYRWVLDAGAPDFQSGGRFAGYVGSCIDVTERKQAGEALRLSEERFRMVVEAAPSAMLMVGEDGRITLANAQAEQVFGYPRSELLGMEVERLMPARLRAAHRSLRDGFFADPRARTMGGRQLLGLRKDGSEFPVEVGLSPIRGREGLFVLSAVVDITERVKAEMEARQQRSALAHLSRVTMLGELSGSLAHELNQPLTAILSNAQAAQRFMAKEDVDLDELREILADIVEEDKRAGEVIRQLRLLLKKGETNHQLLDMNEVVLDVLKLVRTDLVNHNVTIETELPPELPRVSGDRIQLQQVLLNLVMNACEAVHANAQSDRRTIAVRTCQSSDGCVLTTVSDRGSGIALHQINHIFEPFFTTKAEGMGLGLTVCRTIIASHGGTLTAENNAGGGASFHITLQPAGAVP